MNEDLLQPSLRGPRTEPIYSAGAGLAVAFFGGAVATVAFSALSSRRLGRLGRDAPVYALALALWLAMVAIFVFEPAVLGVDPAATDSESRTSRRVLTRGLGLALWLGFYWLHRSEHRAMKLTGSTPPSPWWPGLGCIVLGVAASVIVVMAFLVARDGAA